jgi:NADP-dependent 3-hydroxy acid dehydrogenase YdfG
MRWFAVVVTEKNVSASGSKGTALITGASAGIGAFDLTVVALNKA